MAYPVGTRVMLTQDDGLFPMGVVLQHIKIEPYRSTDNRMSTEGWKVIRVNEEGLGYGKHLPMVDMSEASDDGTGAVFMYEMDPQREGVAFRQVNDFLLEGDRVYIRENSRFYSRRVESPANPKCQGHIREIGIRDPLPIQVHWDNGHVNSYAVKDLILADLKEGMEGQEEEVKDFSLRQRIKDTATKLMAEGFPSHTKYSIISANPHWIQGVELGACHAAVNRSTVPDRFCIISCINHDKVKDRETTKEDMILYYDWLFNRSPLKEAFLTKNAERAIKQGYILISCKPAANLMQAANVAHRQPWESHSVIVDYFAGMVREGVNENLAFILAHCTDISKDNARIINLNGGMHRVFDWNQADVGTVVDFVHGKLQKRTQSYRVNNRFGGADDLIRGDNRHHDFFMVDLLKSFTQPGGEDKKTMHVFAAAKKDGQVKAVNVGTRIKWLVEHVDEIQERLTV